ncbi:MAG: ABC transporter substrate-binding protein [Pseudomonadales bacterium]|jgi:phospholipid transport system substrate-binding protein
MLSFVLFFIAPTIQAAPAPIVQAADPVKLFHDGLIEMMKSSDYGERIDILSRIVDSTFDNNTVARIALGRNWRNLSDEEKTGIVFLMSEVIVSSYASRFGHYTRETFDILETKAVASNRSAVRTRFNATDQSVSLDYQLVLVNDEWKIYDVVANGVSDLSLKRASYAEAFTSGGITLVRNQIKKTIEDNETKALVASEIID